MCLTEIGLYCYNIRKTPKVLDYAGRAKKNVFVRKTFSKIRWKKWVARPGFEPESPPWEGGVLGLYTNAPCFWWCKGNAFFFNVQIIFQVQIQQRCCKVWEWLWKREERNYSYLKINYLDEESGFMYSDRSLRRIEVNRLAPGSIRWSESKKSLYEKRLSVR